MILYLCRHGIAEEGGGKMRDEERALTGEGIRKFKKGARGFARHLVEGGEGMERGEMVILTSPLVRARETAGILQEAMEKELGRSVQLRETPTLAPPGRLEGLLAELRELHEMSGVVAVGHEPYLGAWIGELCFRGEGFCELKKGGMAAIELDERGRTGKLRWLVTGGMLKELGEK